LRLFVRSLVKIFRKRPNDLKIHVSTAQKSQRLTGFGCRIGVLRSSYALNG
jgi:hypothetical protein